VPRVDIIAIHDIDETLLKAWLYRKKSKRRGNEPRTGYASAGLNSFDGEGGLGTTGSPAPGRYSPDLALMEDPEDASILGMLASVPEDEDVNPGLQTSDDFFRRRPRMRKKATLPHDRRWSSGRFAAIAEEEKVSSVGEMGDSRRPNADVLSDRQSSLDQGIERRVNWLSDLDMLPIEIPGARIMCYTYKGVEKVASPWQYLTELADVLATRLIEKRTSDIVDYSGVPIILIGLGFGALILQRAMNLLALRPGSDWNPTTNLYMVAGVILLDAPAAGPDREQFPRSLAQETKKTWTQDWLGKPRVSGAPSTKIDTLSMWIRFSLLASVHDIPIAWHYSPMVPTPGKVCVCMMTGQKHTTGTLTPSILACDNPQKPRSPTHSETISNGAPS
ncbi:hypothetical protein N657DRAFT_563786, partial [Parathielavia appendiculata]